MRTNSQKLKALQTNFRWIGFIFCAGLLCLLNPSNAAKAQEGPQAVVVESDQAGLVITWTPPEYELTTRTIDGTVYGQLQMPGTHPTGEAGYPQAPVYSRMIGLPPSGEAKLDVVNVEREVVSLPALPLPAPVPLPVHVSPTDLDPQTLPGGGPMAHIPDPAAYATNAFYPTNVAQLSDPNQVRDRRVAGLTIHPLRINPVTRQMEIVRSIQLRIRFTEPAPSTSGLSAQQAAGDAVGQALAATLLNPEAAQWTSPRSGADAGPQQPIGALAAGKPIKVLVDEPGLYALTYTDLQNAGLPIDSLDPRSLKLSYGYPRQEVAISVSGQGDGKFNANDQVHFYASQQFSRYVDGGIYFLSYGGAPDGLRMNTRSGSPTGLTAGTAWRTATAEQNKFYDPLYQGRDGDYWYWAKLAQPDKTTAAVTVSLQTPWTSGPNATLEVWLQGYTSIKTANPDHRVQFKVNENVVGLAEWDADKAHRVSFGIPASYLQQGHNQVQLALPGIQNLLVEGTWLDAIALTYPVTSVDEGQVHFTGEAGPKKYTLNGAGSNPSVYDITAPDAPQQVVNFDVSGSSLTVGDADGSAADYLIVPASQIKRPVSLEALGTVNEPAGADYVIITHPSLAGAIAPLAAHRAGRGLRVTTVDVTALYEVYGDGRMDPEAIKRFLSHAYFNWAAPAPQYVLLVGDGSYDFKNYSGFDPVILLPPYMADVDPWWGETASDNQLVAVEGNDNLPEMLIGRLSAGTPAEVTAIVNKIIQYETNPPGGGWNATHIFVADNPDTAGDFYIAADTTYAELGESFVGRRYYYSDDHSDQPYIYTDAAKLRGDFLDAFTNGASFATFYGHSSWEQWAVESLLSLDNLGQLNNQNRLPIISAMTCFTGFFHHPKDATLDESLLRRPNGGAVAIWGASGLGVGTGHSKLQEGFYRSLMVEGNTNLGAAVYAGKLNLLAAGFHLDLLDTFTLFGDPALDLSKVFKPDLRITHRAEGTNHKPGDPVTFTLTIENTGANIAPNVVVTNEVPDTILSPSWTTAAAGVSATGSFGWTLPDLAPNKPVVIQVSGTIDPSLPDEFAIFSTATVSTSLSELSLANNSSTAFVGTLRMYMPLVTRKN